MKSSIIECESIEDNYDKIEKLGEGTFAAVFSAIERSSNQKCAIKQIAVAYALASQAKDQVKKIKSVMNDHIIKFIRSFYDDEELQLAVVLELCKGSLRGQINKKCYSERELESFLVQMTSAFLELDRAKMMHLDFKPENVLIANDEGNYYKICDFGCSQIQAVSKMSGYRSSAFGTHNYLAPEQHTNEPIQKTRSSADIWSLGVTLYQMIYWKLPFKTEKINEEFSLVDTKDVQKYFAGQKKLEYPIVQASPVSIIEIVKMMLNREPIKRITWSQLKDILVNKHKIEEHQFLKVKDVIITFISSMELFFRVNSILKENIGKGALFWKSNVKFLDDFRVLFVHFVFVASLRFEERIFYKLQNNVGAAHISKAQYLMKNAEKQEVQVCDMKCEMIKEKDDYEQIQQLIKDQLKVCLGKLTPHRATFDKPMTLLDNFCSQLEFVLRERKGLFSSQQHFKMSHKIKI